MCGFFLHVKFASSLLASLAGDFKNTPRLHWASISWKSLNCDAILLYMNISCIEVIIFVYNNDKHFFFSACHLIFWFSQETNLFQGCVVSLSHLPELWMEILTCKILNFNLISFSYSICAHLFYLKYWSDSRNILYKP